MRKKAWFLVLGLLLVVLMTSTALADDCLHMRSDHFVYDENDPGVHGWVCDDCGYYEYIDHIPLCTKPGVCAICGVPCDDSNGEWQWHITSHTHIRHDSEQHWIECDDCGITWNKEMHGYACTFDDPTKCYLCGIFESEASMWTSFHPTTSLIYEYNADKHWRACTSCGSSGWGEEDHYHYCTDPNAIAACVKCGVPTDNIEHASSVIEHDETTCWEVCDDCGEVLWGPYSHEGTCIQKDICYWCGAPCSGEEWFHSNTHIEHDETTCWSICDDCGEVLWGPDPHEVTCTQKDVCRWCGAPCSSEKWGHQNVHMEHDETNHWKVCDDCGEVIWGPDTHLGYCTQKEICIYCGAPCPGAQWSHVSYIGRDETTHWEVCENCGEVTWGPYPHEGTCIQKDVCYWCGAPCSGEEWDHHGDGHIEHDETTCWAICDDCGEIIWGPDPHKASSDDPTVCKYCGAPMPSSSGTTTDTPTEDPTPTPTPGTSEPTPEAVWDASLGKLVTPDDPTYTGFVDFEGGKFYIKNGQQATDFVAPVQIDGIFYAFEHGRVQMENLMTAFEGGLFAFNGGTLRTDLTGLAEYNGEKFVFSQGQYQRSANGPYLDPISGKWVYVNEGQFYPITDLITYEGEIFYFIDGILASGYTGIVYDFNGTGLYIASGQHYKITDLVSCSNGEVLYVVDGRFASWYTGVVTDFKGTELNVVDGKVVQ